MKLCALAHCSHPLRSPGIGDPGVDQEQGWRLGSLDWILVAKAGGAQLKTTCCGQTEINVNVVTEEVTKGSDLALRGLIGLD